MLGDVLHPIADRIQLLLDALNDDGIASIEAIVGCFSPEDVHLAIDLAEALAAGDDLLLDGGARREIAHKSEIICEFQS